MIPFFSVEGAQSLGGSRRFAADGAAKAPALRFFLGALYRRIVAFRSFKRMGCPGAGAPGFLYRYAGVRSRTDCPSVEELLAEGWTVESIDPRYQTRLMKKEIPWRGNARLRRTTQGEATPGQARQHKGSL